MVTLLIIADDFTGALDTGVQFATVGAVTRVVTGPRCGLSAAEPGVQVLVVDAETRHMAAEEAYACVRQVAADARALGVPYLYKKTDSALRGNIGSELKALLDGAGGARLHFIPAMPSMDRVTVDGVQYVDGKPVSESIFGRDPFEPVRHSAVADIIAAQTDTPVHLHRGYTGGDGRSGIHVYDAAAQREVAALAAALKADGALGLMAGCAGFACALHGVLGLAGTPPAPYPLTGPLLVACGSVNPITQAQLDEAEKSGFTRVRLTPAQKLEPDWLYSEECKRSVAAWSSLFCSKRRCILDVNDLRPGETAAYARAMGLTLEQMRVRISTTLGALLKRMLDQGVGGTLLLTGGDTLLAFMRQIGVEQLTPAWEAAPGVVLSRFTYKTKSYHVLSKSGGFGGRSLFSDLARSICAEREQKEEQIC